MSGGLQEVGHTTERPVAEAWARPVDDVLGALGVSRDRGLAAAEVTERRRRFGRNRLRQAEIRSAWRILLDQFRSLMVALLGAASALSFAFGETTEGLAISSSSRSTRPSGSGPSCGRRARWTPSGGWGR